MNKKDKIYHACPVATHPKGHSKVTKSDFVATKNEKKQTDNIFLLVTIILLTQVKLSEHM